MISAILAIFANPVFIGIALQLLDAFIAKKNADAATKAALQKIAEFLRANGVAKAKISYSAEDQIAAGDDMWKDRETPKPVEEKKP